MARIDYFSETCAINRVPEDVTRSRAPEPPHVMGVEVLFSRGL
ncbi:hypothetical protein [Streptomyces sp. NPDC088358]